MRTIEEMAEKEVEMVERDETLTDEEKDIQIRAIYFEAREMAREQYDE